MAAAVETNELTRSFGDEIPDGLRLQVLDSTHPDVVLRIGNTELTDDEPFINALALVGVNDKVPVQLFRDGKVMQVTVELMPR